MLSENTAHFTPYEDVNVLLGLMLAKLQVILGERMVAFYLFGSLSLGDFDPASSDVDFLIAVNRKLPEAVLERLREMHAEIATNSLPYATRLEGSYIPREALRRYDPQNARHPTIGVDWPFQIGFHSGTWILESFILREHGVVVWGPSPRTLIDPIAPQQLQAAVCEILTTFWRKQLDEQPDWLRPRDYQAFAALTLCRALYTLHTGALCSKLQAAAWAQEVYPQWKPIIERALAWRSQHEIDDLNETLAFLREAFAVAQAIGGPLLTTTTA